MNKKLIVSASLASMLMAAPISQAADTEITTLEQKASYLMGLRLGISLHDFGYELDVDALKQGIKESGPEATRTLSDDDMRATIAELQERAKQRQIEAYQKLSEENFEAGEAFLADNAKKEGVVTTESGLQYKILTEGEGANPSAEDTVQVNYRGTLINGTEFDSSFKHGRPATFPLNGVIPGWTEGLQKLKKGGKAELYIPSNLAYGPAGMGQAIGPNSVLVFEVELLDINPEPEAGTSLPSGE